MSSSWAPLGLGSEADAPEASGGGSAGVEELGRDTMHGAALDGGPAERPEAGSRQDGQEDLVERASYGAVSVSLHAPASFTLGRRDCSTEDLLGVASRSQCLRCQANSGEPEGRGGGIGHQDDDGKDEILVDGSAAAVRTDAGVRLEDGSGAAPAAEAAVPVARRLKLRLRNDTFYDDYLHRGGGEADGTPGPGAESPLWAMSYYDYGAHVRVVEGDPSDLGATQYPFVAHHGKYHNYVQELRTAPVVPYINGFTMPTREKDAETNACFKQVLLRPHWCPDQRQCRKIAFTRCFCEATGKAGADAEGVAGCASAELSFIGPWRQYLAEQQTVARAADARLERSRKIPVLTDVACLRQWWLPQAVRGGHVHDVLVPLLSGRARHASDVELHGSWFRRSPSKVGSACGCDSEFTQRHMADWVDSLQEDCVSKPCRRMPLTHGVAWEILRPQERGRC